MAKLTIIKNFLAKLAAGRTDDGIMITLPDPKKIDFQAAMLEDLLMRNGIDPQLIKTEDELKNIVNQIEAVNKQKLQQAESGIRNTESAKVFDLEGQQIPPGSRIMGGKQATETEAEIAQRLAKENKQSVQKILDRKNRETSSSTLDQEIKNAYDKAVKEGKFKGTEEDFRNKIDDAMDEDFATGGRVGLKAGMSRRAFLSLMGSAGAGIGAAKTGLLKLFGKGAGKQVTKEIIKTDPVAGKPSWFDALANRVIVEGDDVTKRFATKDREIVHVKALDDETTVYVYRDLDDGSVRIDIDDPFRNVQGDQGDALVSLEYKPGIADEGTKGKPPDTFQAVENDYANYMDGPDDYVTEVTDNTVTNTKDLTADLTKVKLYAKGQKKPTLKEFVESRKRKETLKQAEENPSQYAADRYTGPDPEDYMDDMASGGIARMLGE